MKKGFVLCILWLLFLMPEVYAQVSALYAGGSIYYGRDYSIDEIKRSGFNTLIVWTIHIDTDGNLNFNGEFPLVMNGEYVGDETYPEFRNDIKELKSITSSITRIEFGLSAWLSGTYDNIRVLIENEGTGSESILYKNFKALREAIPEIDAMNNDDELTYHVPSAVAFHTMLYDIGFKTALVPYIRAESYWKPLTEQVNAARPGAVDRLYLQVYAGGAGNDPCASVWDFGLPVYPGVWGGTTNDTPDEVHVKMENWQADCGSEGPVEGGFMWLYDDFDNIFVADLFADAIIDAFDIQPDIPILVDLPFPANEEVGTSVDADLNWVIGGFDVTNRVYYGDTPVLTEDHLVSTQSSNTYDPGTQENGVSYYWRVDQINAGGITVGDVWSYTTEVVTPQPGELKEIYPANNQVYLPQIPTLTWEADDAVSYDLYFGESNPPPLVGSVSRNEYSPGQLIESTTYYWRVDTRNSVGLTEGEVSQFSIRSFNLATSSIVNFSSQNSDSKFWAQNVRDGVENEEWVSDNEQMPWIELAWDTGQAIGAVALYDRIDSLENVTSGTLTFSNGMSLMVEDISKTGEEVQVAFDRADVEWIRFQVDAADGQNIGLSEFKVFEYFDADALPGQAHSFEPENATEGLGSSVTLRWDRGLFGKSHNVYLSTDTTIGESDFVINKTSKFHVLNDLGEGAYYWRIDEVNENGVTEGPLLSFNTSTVLSAPLNEKSQIITASPNPAQSRVTFDLPTSIRDEIVLTVLALDGRVVLNKNVTQDYRLLGHVFWDIQSTEGVGQGLYVVRLNIGVQSESFKILVHG